MFGRRAKGEVTDAVWLTAAAREAGLRAQLARPPGDAAGAVLAVRSQHILDAITHDTSAHIASDGYALGDAYERLRVSGGWIITMVDVLSRRRPKQAFTDRPGLHVVERARRARDDAALADSIGWAARITFHSALDDDLLRTHAAHLQPLLQRLGANPDEPITSPMLTAALVRAQED